MKIHAFQTFLLYLSQSSDNLLRMCFYVVILSKLYNFYMEFMVKEVVLNLKFKSQ
jgi:hypothetical protein